MFRLTLGRKVIRSKNRDNQKKIHCFANKIRTPIKWLHGQIDKSGSFNHLIKIGNNLNPGLWIIDL